MRVHVRVAICYMHVPRYSDETGDDDNQVKDREARVQQPGAAGAECSARWLSNVFACFISRRYVDVCMLRTCRANEP